MSEPGPLPAGPQPARDAYARARQMRVERWIDEIVPMSDQVIGQEMCVVTATRNGIDVRKWIASKLRPHQYGDQPTGVTVTNQSNVVLISEERQRELQAVRQRMIEQQKRWEGTLPKRRSV